MQPTTFAWPSALLLPVPHHTSGKIMCQVLRKIVEDKARELRDLTTLGDHEAVQQITEGHEHLVEGQKSC